MEGNTEKSCLSVKEWAVKHMEYVPRATSTNPDSSGNQDFPTKLLSGRLGLYWQYLMRHARSRAQIEHIRANIKIQEFQDVKNKRNICSTSSTIFGTASTDLTLRSDTSICGKRDGSVITFGSSSSHTSERSILLKEYDETKRLLKKSKHFTQKATLDVASRLAECDELKRTLELYYNNIEENYEKSRFLGLLTIQAKDSIGLMKEDSQNLESIFRQRFSVSENMINDFKYDKTGCHVKEKFAEICEKSKHFLNLMTICDKSSDNVINFDYKRLDSIGELVEFLLFPNVGISSVAGNCQNVIDVHEAVLFKVRSITRQVDTVLFPKGSDKLNSLPDRVAKILDEWREQHVILTAETKRMGEEANAVEEDIDRHGINIKSAILELVESKCKYSHGMEELLHNYFAMCDKRVRLKASLENFSNALLSKGAGSAFSDNSTNITNHNLKALVKLSDGHNLEIQNKKEQISRLTRNFCLKSKLIWLERKLYDLLSSKIAPTIENVLPMMGKNKNGNENMNYVTDRILSRLNNFMVSPIYLNMSLNISGQTFGRNNSGHVRGGWGTCANGSLAISDLLRIKGIMKQLINFLEGANSLNFDDGEKQNNSSATIKDKKGNIEEKVKKSKEHSQLLSKLDEVINKVEKAQNHFNFRIQDIE